MTGVQTCALPIYQNEIIQANSQQLSKLVLIFCWLSGLLELPNYPAIQHGAFYWTNTDLCETLHLLFWLCLRWLAFMFWFILPTSPIVFTLDPPTEH